MRRSCAPVFLILALLTSACASAPAPNSSPESGMRTITQAQQGSPKVPQKAPRPAKLSALFAGGHSGTYEGCPERAYSPAAPPTPEHKPAPQGATAGERAPAVIQEPAKRRVSKECAMGHDCSSHLLCRDAQITFQLINDSDEAATHVTLQKIVTLSPAGAPQATLTARSLINTADYKAFDGHIPARTTLTLRLDFQGTHGGPAELGDALPGTERVRLEFGAKGHKDFSLTTTPLAPPAPIVT